MQNILSRQDISLKNNAIIIIIITAITVTAAEISCSNDRIVYSVCATVAATMQI